MHDAGLEPQECRAMRQSCITCISEHVGLTIMGLHGHLIVFGIPSVSEWLVLHAKNLSCLTAMCVHVSIAITVEIEQQK